MFTMELFLIAAVLGLTFGYTTPGPCQDVDTNSCQTFARANPNICSDAMIANSMCKRFCGNCPLRCYSCHAVANPADCTTTVECRPDTKCMLKTYLAPNSQHAHIMSCEPISVCNSLTGGFNSIIGKRASRRDLVLSCCDGDLCNLPKTAITTASTSTATTTPTMFTTTTLLTTTTTQTTTTPTPIPACQRDIVMVLDASDSMGAQNYQTMIDFVRQLLKEIPIGSNHARVALMIYSDSSHIQWKLDKYTTFNQMRHALLTIPYPGRGTNTAGALETVTNSLLTPGAGDRPTAPNAVLVVTDGRSNNPALTASRAQQLHAVAGEVVAIGVGTADRHELNAIATNRHHVYSTQSFSDLHSLIAGVKQHLCF